ncbi:MAG: porin [Verrucomicrobiota bacterium JB023]|nr:porin [Verrucomicrobiota bacterium JB023]
MRAKFLAIGLGCAGSALGNEALDLLEGKITEDEITVVSEDEESGSASSSGESAPEVLVDDTDYSRRWRNSLPPKAIVYENPNSALVQRVAVEGMAEWGYTTGSIDADGGNDTDVDDNTLRRLRLGGVMRAFGNTDLEAKVVADGNGYQGIDTLRATMNVNDGLKVEAGKFRPPFSQEYKRDPEVRVAPGLSPLIQNIAPANTLGVRFETYSGPWMAGLGYFSGGYDKNVPGFGGDGFILANLAYTFSPTAEAGTEGEDVAVPPGHQRWHLDYIYNLDDEAGSIPKGYEHLISTGIEVSSGKFDFAGDFLLANGPVDTAWGMNLFGRYWLYDEAVRFVGRYSYADSDDPDAISVTSGVPSAIGDSTQPLMGYGLVTPVDEFHSFYGGLDWHVYGDHLLFSTGLEYRLLKDEDDGDATSWLWHTGGRVAF